MAPDDADDVRVTDMADWHVTVRFLGQLDESRVDEVARRRLAPSRRCRPSPHGSVRITALGTGARVLFVPVAGAEPLADALDQALDGLVDPRDGPYRGHLTLARARGRGRLPSGLSGLPVSVRFAVGEAALVGLEPRAGPCRAPCRGHLPARRPVRIHRSEHVFV